MAKSMFNSKRKIKCCFECQKRYVGCHSECADYIKERAEANNETKRIRVEKNKRTSVDDVFIKSVQRCKRK